jgi:hypothetical protein
LGRLNRVGDGGNYSASEKERGELRERMDGKTARGKK